MVTSGVSADDEVVTVFNELQRGKKFRYLIYRLSDDKTKIILAEDGKGDRGATYKDFIDALPEKGCRYGVIDYEFKTKDGQDHDRICFVSWVPDTAPIREKMLAASSKEALTKKIESGIHKKFEASDKGDLDEEEFKQKCEKSLHN